MYFGLHSIAYWWRFSEKLTSPVILFGVFVIVDMSDWVEKRRRMARGGQSQIWIWHLKGLCPRSIRIVFITLNITLQKYLLWTNVKVTGHTHLIWVGIFLSVLLYRKYIWDAWPRMIGHSWPNGNHCPLYEKKIKHWVKLANTMFTRAGKTNMFRETRVRRTKQNSS